MAKITQIINDSKVIEDLMLAEYIRESMDFANSVHVEILDKDDLNRLLKEDKIYNKYGKKNILARIIHQCEIIQYIKITM